MGPSLSDASRRYRSIGRYRVYSELASGGMATVHLGCLLGPAGFSKLVAIKCLHQQFAVEKEFVSGFLDEARLASSIHHPNVVASLDVVAEGGELLVVMEYVHGETLGALLRSSRYAGELPPLPVVTRILCDALEGLHAAHVASMAGKCLDIVHRDVSPQNIMVGADGNTRVLDFGIAQAALRSQSTAAGIVKGKVAYMSPEQAQGLPVDARTDIFAAGVVLWESLTGRRLFFAPSSRDAMELLLTSPIPAPSSIVPTLPAELDDVVLRALDRDVAGRFRTARELAEALRKAVAEGSRQDVADWVGRLAKDSLAERLVLLEALEASAIHTQASALLPVVATGSRPDAPVGAENTQTRATSTTSIAPRPARRLPRLRAPWWAAAAGVASALAAWTWSATTTTPEGRPAAAAASVLSAAPAAASPPAPEPVPPPLSADSLPLAEATSHAPKRTAKPLANAAPPRPLASPAGGPPRAKSCTPPYRVDASGVRRIKPECL